MRLESASSAPARSIDERSRSIASTFRPCSAKATARLSVVVVFATPPFWFANAMTVGRRAPRACARRFGRGSRRASPIGALVRVRLPESFRGQGRAIRGLSRGGEAGIFGALPAPGDTLALVTIASGRRLGLPYQA